MGGAWDGEEGSKADASLHSCLLDFTLDLGVFALTKSQHSTYKVLHRYKKALTKYLSKPQLRVYYKTITTGLTGITKINLDLPRLSEDQKKKKT